MWDRPRLGHDGRNRKLGFTAEITHTHTVLKTRQLFCCTLETNIALYVNYTSIKKKRREAQLAVLAKFLRAKLFNILSDYLVPASQMWVCYFIILLFSWCFKWLLNYFTQHALVVLRGRVNSIATPFPEAPGPGHRQVLLPDPLRCPAARADFLAWAPFHLSV